MTQIEKTMAQITKARKRLARIEAQFIEYEEALMNEETIFIAGIEEPVGIQDVTFLCGACAEQEAKIEQLIFQLAILKHGYDWESIKAMAKDLKRHYIGGNFAVDLVELPTDCNGRIVLTTTQQ